MYTGSIPVLASIYFQHLSESRKLRGPCGLQERLQFCSRSALFCPRQLDQNTVRFGRGNLCIMLNHVGRMS